MSKLIDSHSPDLNETSETVAETRENGDAKWTGGESRKQSQGSVTGQPGQQGVKTKHPKYSEMTRSKPTNKSTELPAAKVPVQAVIPTPQQSYQMTQPIKLSQMIPQTEPIKNSKSLKFCSEPKAYLVLVPRSPSPDEAYCHEIPPLSTMVERAVPTHMRV